MTDTTPNPPEDHAARLTAVDVVVVGAGISGLATAEALTRTGATVTVLEARPRTGGRLELSSAVAQVAAATPVWMGQAVKVVAVYDEPFWRRNGLAGAAASRVGPLEEIHDMSGPDGQPAALFGFASAALIGTDSDRQVREQLTRMFGPQASHPRQLTITNWSTEKWTNPVPSTREPVRSTPAAAEYRLFGHRTYQQPDLDGRLHWASTETASTYPGHVEGALEAAERTVAAIQSQLHPHADHPPTPGSKHTRPDHRKAAS